MKDRSENKMVKISQIQKKGKFEFSIVGVKWAARPSVYVHGRMITRGSISVWTYAKVEEEGKGTEGKDEFALNSIALCKGEPHWNLSINNTHYISESVQRRIRWYCYRANQSVPRCVHKNIAHTLLNPYTYSNQFFIRHSNITYIWQDNEWRNGGGHTRSILFYVSANI